MSTATELRVQGIRIDRPTIRLSEAELLLEPAVRFCGATVPGYRKVGGAPVRCMHTGSRHRANDNACMDCRCDGFGSRSSRDDLMSILGMLGLDVAS